MYRGLFYRLGIRMTADSLAEDATVEKIASNQIREVSGRCFCF